MGREPREKYILVSFFLFYKAYQNLFCYYSISYILYFYPPIAYLEPPLGWDKRNKD